MRFIRLKSPFGAQLFAFDPADEVMVAADGQNRREQDGAKLQHGKADPYAPTDLRGRASSTSRRSVQWQRA